MTKIENINYQSGRTAVKEGRKLKSFFIKSTDIKTCLATTDRRRDGFEE